MRQPIAYTQAGSFTHLYLWGRVCIYEAHMYYLGKYLIVNKKKVMARKREFLESFPSLQIN